MSEPAFDSFLGEVGRSLRQRPAEAANVTDELRDHLEERLAELVGRGVPRESAVDTAIEELGDAATLAADFNTVSRDLRRRWIMRYATVTVAAAVLLLLVTAAFWPNTPTAPLAPQAAAQETAPPKEAPVAAAKPTSKEANNARTEQLLASHRIKADYKETRLEDFFDSLRQVKTEDGKTVELQVWVDQAKLAETTATLDSPITFRLAVRLEMLLKLVLTNLGLGYYIDDGVIIVTSKDDVDTRLEVRVYNCRDLLQLPRSKSRPEGGKPAATPAPALGEPGGPVGTGGIGGGVGGFVGLAGMEQRRSDLELIDVLRTNIKPESWSLNGGPGDVAEYRGILVVTQTGQIHRQVEELLEMLRQSAAKETPAAR
jgi:hypothetical protein